MIRKRLPPYHMNLLHKIILGDFPFIDDQTRSKRRPVLVLSEPKGRHKTIIISFITTNVSEITDTDILLEKSPITGLLLPSVIKLHKLASMELTNAKGIIGDLPKLKEAELERKLKKIFSLGNSKNETGGNA